MNSQRKPGTRDDGASAVEFALVFLLLMLLLSGIIQFGWTFFQYLQVEHAAREGARWAALSSDGPTILARTQRAAPALDLDPTRVVIRVEGDVRTGAAPILPTDRSKATSVTVSYDSPVLMPFIGNLFGGAGTIPLTGAAEMRVE